MNDEVFSAPFALSKTGFSYAVQERFSLAAFCRSFSSAAASIDPIDGYKLSVIEHRPVVERTGQGFCLFERVHMDELRGEPRAFCLRARMRRFRADDAAKVL